MTMLCLCSSIILITKNDTVRKKITNFCQKNRIILVTDTAWAIYKAVNEDFIVIDSSLLYTKKGMSVSSKYTKRTIPIYEKGFEQCRYDYNQVLLKATEDELNFAFLTEVKTKNIRLLFTDFGSVFDDGIHKFDFASRVFSFKGEYIYVSDTQISFLYDWLMLKKRDNKKRGLAFTMRKKFGKDFLALYNSKGEQYITSSKRSKTDVKSNKENR